MTKEKELLILEHKYLKMTGGLPVYSTLEELKVLVTETERIEKLNEESTFNSHKIKEKKKNLLDNRLVRYSIAALAGVFAYGLDPSPAAAGTGIVLTLIILNVVRAI